jgi:hypothetical protein
LKRFKFGGFAVTPLVLTALLWALPNLKIKFYFKISKRKKIKISQFGKAEAKILMPMAWQRPC